MLDLGLRPEHLNLSPSQLDQKYPRGFCCGGIDSNGFFTNWPDNKKLAQFRVTSTPPNVDIQCVSGGQREGSDPRWLSGIVDLITSTPLSPGTVTGNMPAPVKTLLESGTNEPCSLPGFYESLNECRGTYTILLADATFTGQILNASSGDVLSQTSFLLQTSDTVSTSLCINQRFGSATLSPYGIANANDKLCDPLDCQWNGPDLSFDIGYKADITFDDPNSTDPPPEYNTIWNKWNITVCNGVFSWIPSPNNCVLLPQITNISSNLLFETVGATIGVKIDIDWSPSIKIGSINTECNIIENISNYCTEGSGSEYYSIVEGPCLVNINGRIYDPGPCGLENGPAPNSNNTPWSGLYYGNIEEFIYSKSWVYYLWNNSSQGQLRIPVFPNFGDSQPCDAGTECYCSANRNFALIVNQREAYQSTNFGYTVAEYGAFWNACGDTVSSHGVWRTPDLSEYVNCPCLNGEYWDYSAYLNIDWWDTIPGNTWSFYQIGTANDYYLGVNDNNGLVGTTMLVPGDVTDCVLMETNIDGFLTIGNLGGTQYTPFPISILPDSWLTDVVTRCGNYREPNPPSWPNPSCPAI
jgi:hypothetical protein